MSIHFISGKPGGGKTLYSVRLIVDELVRGNRPVVTNVPLKMADLAVFIQERYPKAYEEKFIAAGVHLSDRVQLISEDDLPKFFTYRAGIVRVESVTNVEWKAGKRPDFTVVKDSGVFYVLDEIHIAFNARAWAETGAEVLYYLSQHRKLGDDVVCITQSVGNVDKQFRSVAQDFTYIKNLSKQKAGLFYLPAIFTRNTYCQPATDNSKPMESGTFSLDVSGLASCYDTARGVGIHGRSGADTNARKKGLHWAVAVVGIPLVIWALVHFTPGLLVSFLHPHGLKPVLPSDQPKVSETNSKVTWVRPAVPATVLGVGSSPASENIDGRIITENSGEKVDSVLCVGYILGKYPKVYLSDGRVADSEYGEVQKIYRSSVVCFGTNYPMVLKPRGSYIPDPPLADYPMPVASPVPEVNRVQILGSITPRELQVPSSTGGFEKMGRQGR